MNMWKKEISSIELKLRSLSNIEVPSALKGKLIAQIPQTTAHNFSHYHKLDFWGWGLSSAAAAVFVLGVFLFQSNANRIVADPIAMPCSFSMVDKNGVADRFELPQILYNEPNCKN
ncbi:MAG: hypothetical protein LLF92_06600 [Planctomycetaceae bacterium]|nr:hypothetical protein [Planctomycetaceae bacterium]